LVFGARRIPTQCAGALNTFEEPAGGMVGYSNKMASGLDKPFNFCVVDVCGEVMSYRMHPLDLISKVINTHCQARDLDQDPQFFYYRNECILPTERADQIGLGAGGEIQHIFMLDFF
jgi:hypothetical protein